VEARIQAQAQIITAQKQELVDTIGQMLASL
jgi:hypothetical protein